MAKDKNKILQRNKAKYSQESCTQQKLRLKVKYAFHKYTVYDIFMGKTIVGYIGIFKDGKYNYAISHRIFDCLDSEILNLIHSEFSEKTPFLYLNENLYT